jgi:CubicO group peptidase (beta-lactamase class C family)
MMKTHWLLSITLCLLILSGCSSRATPPPSTALPTVTEIPASLPDISLLVPPSPAAGISSETKLAIEKLVLATLGQTPLAGLTLGIQRGEQTPYIAGYGYADLETQEPAGADTVYMLGSVTKQFTAAVIMHLVERGMLGLDDPISQYLEGLPSRWEIVTIRQLLTHTGGIPNYSPDSIGFDISQFYTPEELMVRFTEWNLLDFEPGKRWEYSNRGYFLLGMIIKQVSGESYSDYLQQNITGPLGLEHTTSCPINPENLAQGYRIKAYGTEPELVTNVNASFAYGAGDLCSTAGDLLEWQRALAGGLVVSDASYQLMITPAVLPDGTQTGYGFGLEIEESNGRSVIKHAGGIPTGFVSMLVYYPNEDYGIVLLTNTFTAATNPLVSLEALITTEVLTTP